MTAFFILNIVNYFLSHSLELLNCFSARHSICLSPVKLLQLPDDFLTHFSDSLSATNFWQPGERSFLFFSKHSFMPPRVNSAAFFPAQSFMISFIHGGSSTFFSIAKTFWIKKRARIDIKYFIMYSSGQQKFMTGYTLIIS